MNRSDSVNGSLTAHSGFGQTAPNSWNYLHHCQPLGFARLEIDLRLDVDRGLILAHDVSQTPTGLRWSEVREWAESNNQSLNIDIKDLGALFALKQELLARPLTPEGIITGCGLRWCLEWTRDRPPAPVLLNLDRRDIRPDEWCELARWIGAQGLNVDLQRLTPRLARTARRQNLDLEVWTVATHADREKANLPGVTGMTTLIQF